MTISIKECLLVRSSRGGVLADGIFSVYSAAAEVEPVNDNRPANPGELDAPPAIDQRTKIDAAE
jgi:hypothetical protein